MGAWSLTAIIFGGLMAFAGIAQAQDPHRPAVGGIGSPIDAMTKRQRRFYFDQEGRLTGKLGVRHTPAVAEQDGRVVKISEIVLRGKG